MNDSLELLFGMLVCVMPPVLVVGLIVWAVRASSGGRGRLEQRFGSLEAELTRLRGENATLAQRLSRLESGARIDASAPPAASGQAISYGASQSAPGSAAVTAAAAELVPASGVAAPSASEPSGNGSEALASVSEPNGDGSEALASVSEPNGDGSEALGSASEPSGNGSEALGSASEPNGDGSEALGSASEPSGNGSEALGSASEPNGNGSEALGSASEPNGNGSEALGSASEPSGDASESAGNAAESVPNAAESVGSASQTAAAGSSPGAGAAGGGASASVSGSAPPSGGEPHGPRPGAFEGGWERWIGVRGAAALGASILVIAGIYFFEYSIEHGLITPAMRMIAGTAVGLGCVLASELRLRRTHTVLADWLGGAGIAILYVAFWAGRALYGLYPSWAAAVLMIAVTAACVTLALRRESAPIAVLGLLGGFVTPLALSTGSDRPIPLFGYILLLDGAMLWVAYRRRWGWMALLCLVATGLYQSAWLLARLDQPRMLLGTAVVTVFAALFAALPTRRAEEAKQKEDPVWRFTRSAGVILPLLFSIPLAVRTDLGDTFWPTAVQLVLLAVAACWVGARHRSTLLPSSAALLAVGAVLGFALGHDADTAREVWQLAGLALALASVFHVFAEIERRRGRDGSFPSIVAVLSMLCIALLAAPLVHAAGLWPWLMLWAVLGALGLRLGSFPDREALQLGVAVLVALGLGVTFAAGVGQESMPGAPLFLAILALFAVLAQLAGVLPRRPEARRFGDQAAVVFALVLVPLVAMVLRERAVPMWALYGSTLLLAVLALFAAARAGAAGWLPLVLLGLVFSHGVWVARRYQGPFDLLELGALAAAVLLMSAWPIVAPKKTRESPWAWRTAAMAGPVYLLALRHVWLDVLGPSAIGALPLSLAVISIGAATAVRLRGPDAPAARRVAMVWLTATAAGFVTLAIPMQLAQEWITIGWALEAVVLLGLWRRFDHAGLKYLAFGLAGVVLVRLVANPYVLGYYERSPIRIFNWLSYTYLVPAAALLGMYGMLRDREIERRRAWERPLFPNRHPMMANLAASAAVLVLFAWLNLTIVDWFATGPDSDHPHRPAPGARPDPLPRLGRVRAEPARRRALASQHRPPRDQSGAGADHRRQGLPLRPGPPGGPLPRRVAGRSGVLADPHLPRLPALRVPHRARTGAPPMRNAILSCLALFVLVAPASAQAPDATRLFPFEASIEGAGEPGAMTRVALPAEVMSRARPDLSDVRIHDAGGHEVPYLVGSGVSPWPRAALAVTFAVTPTSVERRIEEGDSLAPTWRETVQVAPPGNVAEGSRWTLILDSNAPRFVRTVVLRFVDGRERTELARASVFRLPDPLRERLSIPLPPLPEAHGRAPRIEIELWGEGGYIEPRIRFRETRAAEPTTTLDVPLEEIGRETRDGTTFVDLARPPGVVPDRIRVETSTGTFYRVLSVSDLRQGWGPSRLGGGSVYRVRELEGAETLEVPVEAAQGETLRVAIEDGDSPALADVRFEAVVRQPVLAFAAPDGSATLRFGGGRVRAPRYDLSALARTGLGEALSDLHTSLATLGPVHDNPRFDAGPALAFAMRPGRPVSTADYTHVAQLTVGDTPEGASRIRLPLSVLAAARTNLADLRIVDARDRQWPYVVAPRQESDTVDARMSTPESVDGGSRYTITPPAARANVDRLILRTDAPYLARQYVLFGIDDDGRRVELTRGALSREPNTEPAPLEIELTPIRVSRLELRVEDGNDAPLAFTAASVSVPSPTLFVAAPAGEYWVLVGDPDASAPRYELAQALDLVLSTHASEAEVGEAAANPAHVEPPWYEGQDASTWMVWAVLILAVLVLGLVTLRLARSGGDSSEGSREAAAGDDDPEGGGSARSEAKGEGAQDEGAQDEGADDEEPPSGSAPLSF